jgi:hypothetical protein
MGHILKAVNRKLVALSLVALIAGVPQAIACELACGVPVSVNATGEDQHEHSGADGHHASHDASNAVLQTSPHHCERDQQQPTLAEPSSYAKAPQAITTTALVLEPPREIDSKSPSVAAQRPPGSRFLSRQLRI